MKGLVISWTVALEANISPTFTFSLVSRPVASGQMEELCRGCVAGTSSADGAVALGPTDLTVWSYSETMLRKVAGGDVRGSELLFGPGACSEDWSRFNR